MPIPGLLDLLAALGATAAVLAALIWAALRWDRPRRRRRS